MKKTLTKVFTIIAIVLVGLIATAAIVLALVKSNFNQVIDTNKIAGITVYKHEKDNYYSDKHEKDDFNKMKSLYNAGTKESVMSALFQGAYGKKAKAEVLKNTVSTSSLKSPSEGSFVLKIDFKETMTLKVNGEVVEDSTITGNDKTVKFTSVYFDVANNETLTKVKCYIVSSSNENYSYRQVSFPTHHSELYNFVDKLEFPG